MKKLLKWLSIALLATVMMVGLGVACLLLAPQWILNNTTAPYVFKYLKSSGIDVTYSRIDLLVTSDDLLNKHISIDSNDLCLKYEKVFSGCYKKLNIVAKVNLFGSPVVLTQIGPLIASGGSMAVVLTKTENEDTGSSFGFRDFVKMIKYTSVKPFSVERSDFSLTDEAGKVSKAELSLNLTQVDPDNMEITASVDSKSDFPLKHLYLKGRVSQWSKHDIPDLNLAINLLSASQLRANSKLTLTNRDGKSWLDASSDIVAKKTQISAKVKGSLTLNSLDADVSVKAGNMSGGVKSVSTKKCHIGVDARDDYSKFSVDLSNCGVKVSRGLFENEGRSPIEFPRDLDARINAKVNFSVGKNITFTESRGRIDLEPMVNDLYKLEGGLDLTINGDLGRESNPDLVLNIDSKLEVWRFQALVSKLANSDFSIPAPFNTLEGVSRCDIKGKIDLTSGIIKVPHSCMIKLKGPEQSLDLVESGNVLITVYDEGISPKIEAAITLNDIELFLPDFDLTEPVPKLTSDARFVDSTVGEYLEKKKEQASQKRTSVEYNVTIATDKKPVLIHTPTLKTVLPIHFNLTLSSRKKPEGTIKVAPFAVKILKKDLNITRINLDFHDQSPNTIDAKAVIERTEFDLILVVFGNMDKPKIDLSSDPVQTDSQMMSSLLYGGDYSQLDSGQQRSVSETSAAAADGAIGLISMFYLATTPVESVGYNPHTKQFRADVKIGSGASLQVGSNLDGQSELGLRKRLKGNWYFETLAVSEESSDGTKGVAMLKWANRY